MVRLLLRLPKVYQELLFGSEETATPQKYTSFIEVHRLITILSPKVFISNDPAI